VTEPVDLERLLLATSRTFALAIPYLPEPTRSEVTIAYLLFRVADTFEDATRWPRALRIEALEEFSRLLGEAPAPEVMSAARRWADEVPCEQPAYRELLAQFPGLLDAFFALRPSAVELIRAHTGRTARGMAGFVGRTSDQGEIRLADLADLEGYCYVVAGIVGELLTELFLLERPQLATAAPGLRARSRAFGEGLQLVNILKDSETDARDGKRYLPDGVPRADVVAIARRDLTDAADYVLTLQRAGAERGLLAFTAFPVELAFATLERVEASGPGAKVTRAEVYAIVQRLNRALDAGDPAVRLKETGSRPPPRPPSPPPP
jgi:farnesyl-diphosphate farnesyltransferase